MEEFVAVKPMVDFGMDIITMAIAADVDELDLKEFLSNYDVVINKLAINQSAAADLLYLRFLASLKRDALIFDKIYVLGNQKSYGNLSKEIVTELEWLMDQNIVTFVNKQDIIDDKEIFYSISGLDVPDENKIHKKRTKLVLPLLEEMAEIERDFTTLETNEEVIEKLKKHQNLLKRLIELIRKYDYPIVEFFARLEAVKLENLEKIIATPLLSYKSYLKKLPNSNKSDVAQVIIGDLPLPDSNTPWEKIIEYRENPNNRRTLLSLRRWMRNLVEENLSSAECKQELDWLKSEFQAHLKLHQMKANSQTFEAIIKLPLEILENLVTLKFSKLPDPLFAIKKRQISLMEAELNAPGREIAYLIKSNQSFE